MENKGKVVLILIILLILIFSIYFIYFQSEKEISMGDHFPRRITSYNLDVIPIIDGTISNDEWGDTEIRNFTWLKSEQSIIDDEFFIRFGIKHNATKIFFLIEMNDSNEIGEYSLTIYIDVNSNEKWEPLIDKRLRFYTNQAGFWDGPTGPGWAPVYHDEPVNSTFHDGIHTIEIMLNKTRITNDTQPMGIGIEIVKWGTESIVSIPDNIGTFEGFPEFILSSEKYG